MWLNVLGMAMAIVAVVFSLDELRVGWIKREAMKKLERRIEEAERRRQDR